MASGSYLGGVDGSTYGLYGAYDGRLLCAATTAKGESKAKESAPASPVKTEKKYVKIKEKVICTIPMSRCQGFGNGERIDREAARTLGLLSIKGQGNMMGVVYRIGPFQRFINRILGRNLSNANMLRFELMGEYSCEVPWGRLKVAIKKDGKEIFQAEEGRYTRGVQFFKFYSVVSPDHMLENADEASIFPLWEMKFNDIKNHYALAEVYLGDVDLRGADEVIFMLIGNNCTIKRLQIGPLGFIRQYEGFDWKAFISAAPWFW